jgi:molybdopterin converting factor small subunit
MRLEEDILLLRLIGKDNNNIISGVIEDFREQKKAVVSSFSVYVEKYKKNALKLINSEMLYPSDLQKADELAKQAKIWNNFYDYPEVAEIVSKLDKKISEEKERIRKWDNAYDIASFDNIYGYDDDKYGAKTAMLAKYSDFIAGLKFNDVKIPHGFGISYKMLEIFFESAGKKQEYDKLNESYIAKIEEFTALRQANASQEQLEEIKKTCNRHCASDRKSDIADGR